MTATSGRKCSESYESASPLGSLVRMCLESTDWHSNECVLTWKPKALKSKRLVYRLAVSVPRNAGNDDGLWPTPAAEQHNYQEDPASFLARREILKAKKINGNGAGMPLGVLARLAAFWPTATTSDAKASGAAGYSTESGRHSGTTLTDCAVGVRGTDTGTTQNGLDATTGKRGRLNPAFALWLMGFPTTWLD